jgi:hypothetical protein
VLATVLDADAGEVRSLKPVTKAVRGAMLLPYWMVNGLAGGGTIARFLATAGLVVGGVLLSLSLFGVLGGAAAASATVGAAALLAALAYSAAKTGTLLHAAALLAPVGPLAAYAWSAGDAAQEAASRVLVVLLAAGALYVLASIPWPLSSPVALLLTWLDYLVRTTKRLAERWKTNGWPSVLKPMLGWLDRLGWKTNGRISCRLLKLLLLAVLGGALFFGGRAAWDAWGEAVTAGSEGLRDSAWVVWLGDLGTEDWFNVSLPLIVILGVIAFAVVVIAYRQGALLQTWRPKELDPPTTYPPEGKHAVGVFVRDAVRHPAGVAASWAPVYGATYLAAAALLFHLTLPQLNKKGKVVPREDWVVFSLWWLLAIGVLLCLVAPWAVTRSPRKHTRAMLSHVWRQLATETANPTNDELLPQQGNEEQRLLYALLKYGVAYSYIVSPEHKTKLRLNLRGSRLLRQVQEPEPR